MSCRRCSEIGVPVKGEWLLNLTLAVTIVGVGILTGLAGAQRARQRDACCTPAQISADQHAPEDSR